MRKFFFILVLVLTSCGGHRPPGNLIPPGDMEKILADVHLADAMAQSNYLRRIYKDMDSLHYAQKVLAKYGYTLQQFDSTISWYAGYPEEYEQLYEKVINRLIRLEGKLKIQYEDSLRLAGMDNMWKGKDTIVLPRDGAQDKVHFSVNIFGVGIYTISADIRLYPDDSTQNPSIRAWFFNTENAADGPKKHFPVLELVRRDSFVRYSISDTLLACDSIYNHLEGWLLDHDNKDGKWSKHAELRNIIIRFTPRDTLAESTDSPSKMMRRFRQKLKVE